MDCLIVTNTHSKISGTFTMMEDIDAFHDIEIEVGDVSSRFGACITILIDQSETYGMIQRAAYRPSCEINGKMEPHEGTILMLQGALRYVFQKYKTLKFVSLSDKSTVVMQDIHITAKRLLQKRQGWYQEWLGAIPDERHMPTMRLMKVLANMRPTKQDITTMNERKWGSTKEIEEMARRYLGKSSDAIIGTSWIITRKAVKQYNVETKVVVHRDTSRHDGGGNVRNRDDIFGTHAVRLFRMWKRLAKKI